MSALRPFISQSQTSSRGAANVEKGQEATYAPQQKQRISPYGLTKPVRFRPNAAIAFESALTSTRCVASNDASGHEPPHALQQIPGGYAARSTRMSISLRSVLKSSAWSAAPRHHSPFVPAPTGLTSSGPDANRARCRRRARPLGGEPRDVPARSMVCPAACVLQRSHHGVQVERGRLLARWKFFEVLDLRSYNGLH